MRFLAVGLLALLALSVAGSAAAHSRAKAAHGYIYWTNSRNGSIGRANLNGTGVNQSFIGSTTGGSPGGGGMAAYGGYVYWTAANGGTATTIARARLNGSGLNTAFIGGGSQSGSVIGRANLDGTHVNRHFIRGAKGPYGIAIVP